MENRKEKEAEFHDKIREGQLEEKDIDRFASNKKFYSVNRESVDFVNDFLAKRYAGKKVLDYCCGNGDQAISLAKKGIVAFGIDISEASIKNAKGLAEREGLADKVFFSAMDAEKTTFPGDSFDAIVCSGVLHHLDIEKAYKEMARILKPEGKVICAEPLAYNSVFQLYRRLTPGLRTKWEMEHILSRKDINLSKKYFSKIEKRFFHLFTLLAVPFRKFGFFDSLLSLLEKVDSFFLKIPIIKWFAWQIVFIVSEPKK